MSSSDSPTLTCPILLEWMNAQQMTTRKVNFKSGLLRILRNGFREMFLEISSEKSATHKFRLKNIAVHSKFMNEGKCTINFKDDNARAMISNAPPSQLVEFLKLMYIKLQGESAAKISLKERLEGKGVMEEISPLTSKEVTKAKDKLAPKDTTPKTGLAKKRPDRGQNRDQSAQPPSKRRCLTTVSETPLTPEQQRVLQAVVSGRNIFFTGSAGTGKSFLLRKIIASLPPDSTFATASTGVAACHIGGYTLHSFAGVGSGQGNLKRLVELAKRPHIAQQWRRCKTLIIDEISMVDGRFFDKLEYVAREVRCNDKPFGGIQLVLCGDFLQLPPVSKNDNSGEGQAKFCFQSEAWDRCNLHSYELTVVHRQSDPVFIDILQNIRIGRVTPEIISRLQATANHKVDSSGIIASRLCSLTKEAQLINSSKLENLPGPMKEFQANDGDPTYSQTLDMQTPVESVVKLKVGAQVMLLKNINVNDGLVNGARGVVVKFSTEGLPVVKFRSGEHTVKYEKWSVKVMGGSILSRKQIPLKLAWAFSIHKSQGLTLDCVEMSLGKVFEAGQAYVALSRAKSLASLRVLDFDPKHVWANPEVLKFYQRVRRSMMALEMIPLGKKK